MRKIENIFIDSDTQAHSNKSGRHVVPNFGYHYVVNSHGMVLNPIDVSQPGTFMPKPTAGQEDLNRCSIGIKYNGTLSDRQLRSLLIALLLDLRNRYPDTKILAKDEYDRWHIKVRDDMNDLRRELRDYPLI